MIAGSRRRSLVDAVANLDEDFCEMNLPTRVTLCVNALTNYQLQQLVNQCLYLQRFRVSQR